MCREAIAWQVVLLIGLHLLCLWIVALQRGFSAWHLQPSQVLSYAIERAQLRDDAGHLSAKWTAPVQAVFNGFMDRTTVRQLMTRDVVTLDQGQALPMAQELVRMLHIRHLPVVNAEGALVGLVTQRGLLAAHAELIEKVGRANTREIELSIPISKVMETDVSWVSPDTYAVEALDRMLEKKIGSLPVIEQGKVVGIVTSRDFLLFELKKLRGERDRRAGVPAADCAAVEPRAPSRAGQAMPLWAVVLLLLLTVMVSFLVYRDLTRPALRASRPIAPEGRASAEPVPPTAPAPPQPLLSGEETSAQRPSPPPARTVLPSGARRTASPTERTARPPMDEARDEAQDDNDSTDEEPVVAWPKPPLRQPAGKTVATRQTNAGTKSEGKTAQDQGSVQKPPRGYEGTGTQPIRSGQPWLPTPTRH